jgi:phage terminase Nu1 subunit (DNA packaging protein)
MKPESHWLNQTSMAEACSVSLSAFQKWRVQPVARIGRETFYTASDVLANRLAHQARRLSAPATPSESEAAQHQAKIALMQAQAEGQELKNAQLREELAPVDLIAWVVEQAGAGIARHLDEIPAAVKKRVPKLTAADLAIIQREIGKAQKAAMQMTVDLNEFYSNPPTD